MARMYAATNTKPVHRLFVVTGLALLVGTFYACQAVQKRDAATHNNLGNTLRDQGRYDKAEASYRRALEIDPDNATFRANLSRLLEAKAKASDEGE